MMSLLWQFVLLCLIILCALENISRIKIFYKVFRKHPEVIFGRQWLICAYFIYPKNSDKDCVVDYDGDDLDEEDGDGPGEAGASTDMDLKK